jgi:hypothetical protein
MSLKRIEIFNKASKYFEKASNSLKISLKCHAFFKKSLAGIAVLPQCRYFQRYCRSWAFS